MYSIAVTFIDICRGIRYNVIRIFNITFTYRYGNESKIKLYPVGQITKGLFSNYFETQQVNIYSKIVKPGMIVVDAGANIGLYSLIASKIVGREGKVISFEPSKETYHRLQKNIALNKIFNILTENKGLGDNLNEKLVLRQDVGYGDAERYLLPMNEEPIITLKNVNEIKIAEEISIVTLDNYLTKINQSKIDFLKIDTEGFEYYILRGAKQTLINNPEIIILMECTALGTARARTSQMEVFKFLNNINMNIYYWNPKVEDWCSDEAGILNAGNVWVCRNIHQLTI